VEKLGVVGVFQKVFHRFFHSFQPEISPCFKFSTGACGKAGELAMSYPQFKVIHRFSTELSTGFPQLRFLK
jgi:hypothetical protein